MKVFLCCTATICSAANLEAVFQAVNYATDEPVRYHLPVSLEMLGLFCSSCNPTEKRTRRTSPRLVRRCFSRTSSHLVTSVTGMFPSPPSPSALHSPPIAFSHHLPIYNNGGRRGESRQLSQPWSTGTLPAPAPSRPAPRATRPSPESPCLTPWR
jgi:hypothetical protein